MSAHDQPLRGAAADAYQAKTAKADVNWNAIYRQELSRVYNYFRYRFGEDALAEDLTSTTFEKAWRAREKYQRDLGAFTTWLYTIARNVATDHLRSRRVLVPLESLSDLSASDSPHEAYTRQAELEHLGTLLNGLSEHERELIALKYGAELNNREIAGQLGMSESNVGTTLYRVVNKLKERWRE